MANNPTASKQYVLPMTFTPGDITFGSVTEVLIGDPWVIHYQKVGNLYFGLYITRASGGGLRALFGDSQATLSLTTIFTTLDHIAALLGKTVNTYYPNTLDINNYAEPGQTQQQLGAMSAVIWDGATYQDAGSPVMANIAVGFLAN